MKTSKMIRNSARQLSRFLRRALLLPALGLAAGSTFAASEQWQGVPGVSASTNWTDAANWTSPQQTYFNQVQFTGTGANNNANYSVNNVLDGTTGVAQMPIWE